MVDTSKHHGKETPQDTPRKLASAAKNGGHESATRVRAAAEEAAEAGHQLTLVGADVARLGAETVQQTFQSSIDAAYKLAQHSTDQMMQIFGLSGRASEDFAQQSSENVQAIANTSTVLARGFQDILREWLQFTQARFDKNLERLNALTNCRTLPDLIVFQSDFLRENLEQMIDKSSRIVAISAKVTDSAARTITANGQSSRAR
jgi:hypothetical protein